MYSYNKVIRRQTSTCTVGEVKIGSEHPVAVQTMLNAPLSNNSECVSQNISQMIACVEAGSELIRISIPDVEAAHCGREIITQIRQNHSDNEALMKVANSLIADIHFHHKPGILAAEYGFKCLRINPGTLFKESHSREIIQAAKDNDCAIRLGVNTGSLESGLLDKYKGPTPEALLESALNGIKRLEDQDFFNFKISVKSSDPVVMSRAYRLLAAECNYPLHLGVTESGPKQSGTIKSSIGIGSLLLDGIGDTIRVSLSSAPEEEIPVCWNILKSLNIRARGVDIVSCPSCARQGFDVVAIVGEVEREVEKIGKQVKISILGCVVNGIGEALQSDIGITGAWSGNHILYFKGKKHSTIKTDQIKSTILSLIEQI